ncbi:MAG: LTA synthase family protein [Flavisolibacter sp.]
MMRIPRLLLWILSIVLLFLAVMILMRFVFYFSYQPSHYDFPVRAFVMGLRYDLRAVSILGLLMLILCSIRTLNPFKNPRAKTFWNIFLSLMFFFLLIFYVVDFFHYDYLHERLNASALNFLANAGISMHMVWQTYPVLKVLLILLVLMVVILFLVSRILLRYQRSAPAPSKRNWIWVTLVVLLLAVCTWGTVGQFPLRWSNVYTLGDGFRAQLALNPFQSFFSSLSFRHSTYDEKKVRQDYGLMANYLGVQQPDSSHLNFARTISPLSPYQLPSNTNVVLVICESFSSYKSSMWGNPLNTTPYFNSLCQQGHFFDHCFTPSWGTARGVWATITGIPDVESPKTASRNPSIVDQHTLINDFEGYDKYYFLGGDLNWANIRGVLDNNIKGLKVYEQDDFKAGRVDVWGVSDKNLFLEANHILAAGKKPFFAVIQTADNHRPYTIPDEDLGSFKKLNLPQDTLDKYGFDNNDQLNAFRYTDYCFQRFMEEAKNSDYFKNTLFVFVGDHGLIGNVGAMFPKAWMDQSLMKEHVPLLFYYPAHLPPMRESSICSQLDILPSISGLLSRPFSNTAMGKNLFDTVLRKDRFRFSSAFTIDPDEKKAGMVTDDYYFRKSLQTGATEMVSIKNNLAVPGDAAHDSIRNQLRQTTEAFYETARYLLYHNKKKS